MHATTTIPSETTQLDEATVTAAFRGAPHCVLDVGHSRLAAWRFGRGPDVVCVHGWPLHGATFRRLIPRLAERFTMHVFDLPGAGQTMSDAGTPMTIDAHADTVRRAIDVLGLARFAYLAHDSGAASARLAAADDRRVAAIVMGNTEIPGHEPWQIHLLGALSRMPFGAELFAAAMRSDVLRRSPLGFGGCFTDPRFVDGTFGALFLTPFVEGGPRRRDMLALLRDFDHAVVHSLADVHGRITAPVLAIWGVKDAFFPIDKAAAMLGQFAGGATMVRIPEGRLFAHEDHPDAFVDAALPFLAAAF